MSLPHSYVKTEHFCTEAETLSFAAKLSKAITAGAIIFLHGPLGAGKTTFTRGFLRALNFSGKVKSPTYTLVEPYEFPERTVYHFDLYRLQTPQELEYIGIQDYFTNDATCLIEWPDKGVGFLPAPDLNCYLTINEATREMRMIAMTQRGKEIFDRL